MRLSLPVANGQFEEYELTGSPLPVTRCGPFTSRIAYAAAHVVVDPVKTQAIAEPVVDWEATLAYRRHLWSLGFAVAEAMDTSQRGMGLDWPLALELIQRSVRDARACGGSIACGAGTDHLSPGIAHSIDDVLAAYLHQCAAVEEAGGRIILMASRALAKAAQSSDDYARVYGEVLRQVREPVILHWLGPMFDPALRGYWGGDDVGQAMENCLGIIREHESKIDGIKISLLSAKDEISMRSRLPDGVRMYTGDDFNYDRLILGEEGRHSDALLGIFDAIAPAASLALRALDAGLVDEYRRLLAPTISLSRHIFQAPTYWYKTGIVFLAYLNGFQSHFRMIAGAESMRSVGHNAELFRLADRAGLLLDPERAMARMETFLRVSAG